LKYRYQHGADPQAIEKRNHYPAKDDIPSRLKQIKVGKAS
jgi:hypothetical protein